MKNLKDKTLLVFGGNGLVGSMYNGEHWKNVYRPRSNEVDITDHDSVRNVVEQTKPDVIWNNAAYTNVSEAEESAGEPGNDCWKVNVLGTANVASVAFVLGKYLIHTSTGFIFNGDKRHPGPYPETSLSNVSHERGLTYYGKSKLAAERILAAMLGVFNKPYAVIRIDFPFGNPDNQADFLRKMVSYVGKGYSLISDNQITPTYLPDFYKAFEEIAGRELTGNFHVAVPQATSTYEFALSVAQRFELPTEPQEGTHEEFMRNSSVPLPFLGGLSTGATQKKLRLNFLPMNEAVEKSVELYEIGGSK